MVFSSSIFIFYFLPVFLLLYFLADKRYKNFIALAGSLVFYIWGAPLFAGVVLITIIADFFLARLIYTAQKPAKKIWLLISVCFNIAILLFFQYTFFFLENFYAIFGGAAQGKMEWMKYVFPVGISFITFQQLSYLIDVYRDVKAPTKKIFDYALYILLFPQLVNGPIIRFHEIADQIIDRSNQDTIDNKLRGFIRFIIGLAKKVLIADILGVQADRIFAMTGDQLGTSLAWIGALAFAFQVYFDFSGYTDMALGLGRMMGFIFPENFNSPYISRSITEFWRRWHMTLSSWLRDYIFMPLSVKMRYWGSIGLSLSLLITFTLCGMWHKPGWTFILWGAYFGVLLIVENLFLLKLLKKIGKFPAIIITFFLTLMGWVLFRSENLHHAGMFVKRMFSFKGGSAEWGFETDFWVMMAVAAMFSFITAFKFGERLQSMVFEKDYNIKRLLLLGTVSILLFIISVGCLTSSGFNPFIYFRF